MTVTLPGDRLSARTLADVPVSSVHRNPGQPRRMFKDIEQLADSIASDGLLQPITLRRDGDGFIIVAGERRFRAVSHLGWLTVPAIVIDSNDDAGFRLAVLENMARRDMTPVEEAQGLSQLLQTMTAAEVASAVGFGATDGGQVTWKVKLLDCIEELQDLVAKGCINQTKAIMASRLSRNGQLKVMREAGSRQMTDREYAGLCDAIYSMENQLDMFPETKLAPAVVKERKELAGILDACARDASRLLELDIPTLLRGNQQAAMTGAVTIAELIRALTRVKLAMQTESGVSLALSLAEEAGK